MLLRKELGTACVDLDALKERLGMVFDTLNWFETLCPAFCKSIQLRTIGAQPFLKSSQIRTSGGQPLST